MNLWKTICIGTKYRGEMYFLHRKLCLFVVWTTKDVAIVKIEKDEAWAANIPRSTQSHWNNLFEINCAMPQIWSECCFKLHFFYLYFYNKPLLGNPCGQLLSGILFLPDLVMLREETVLPKLKIYNPRQVDNSYLRKYESTALSKTWCKYDILGKK